MSESLTLELPSDVAHQARALAVATNKSVEDIVVEWIGKAAAELQVEVLSDEQVIEIARGQLPEADQLALSELLKRQTELDSIEKARLDELLSVYRRGLVLKARATKEAVSRGIIPRLNGDAA